METETIVAVDSQPVCIPIRSPVLEWPESEVGSCEMSCGSCRKDGVFVNNCNAL